MRYTLITRLHNSKSYKNAVPPDIYTVSSQSTLFFRAKVTWHNMIYISSSHFILSYSDNFFLCNIGNVRLETMVSSFFLNILPFNCRCVEQLLNVLDQSFKNTWFSKILLYHPKRASTFTRRDIWDMCKSYSEDFHTQLKVPVYKNHCNISLLINVSAKWMLPLYSLYTDTNWCDGQFFLSWCIVKLEPEILQQPFFLRNWHDRGPKSNTNCGWKSWLLLFDFIFFFFSNFIILIWHVNIPKHCPFYNRRI